MYNLFFIFEATAKKIGIFFYNEGERKINPFVCPQVGGGYVVTLAMRDIILSSRTDVNESDFTGTEKSNPVPFTFSKND